MIIRIVKMTFIVGKEKEFLAVFERSKAKIRSFKGCNYLQLLRDKNHPQVFFTHSHWNSEDDLNEYRNSELFISTWADTKILFSAKPEAWSLEVIHK
jgi:(4S)-4-hydroxy-5-phosphonooxypentane-2,3-dione isomerase